jgi:hypothetical protein
MRLRRFDGNDDDPDLYDPAYPGQRVIADGKGIRVPVQLTDAAAWMPLPPTRRFTIMDARVREHNRLLDSYRMSDSEAAAHRPHEATATLSDSAIHNARSKSEHARELWKLRLKDAWKSAAGPSPIDTYGEGDDRDEAFDPDDDLPDGVSASELERARWIDRMSRQWQDPMPRGTYAGPNPSGGYGGPGRYAQSVWSAQNAIDPRSPGAWGQVERARRVTTRESPTDAGDDRALAYSEYLNRVATDWMR